MTRPPAPPRWTQRTRRAAERPIAVTLPLVPLTVLVYGALNLLLYCHWATTARWSDLFWVWRAPGVLGLSPATLLAALDVAFAGLLAVELVGTSPRPRGARRTDRIAILATLGCLALLFALHLALGEWPH